MSALRPALRAYVMGVLLMGLATVAWAGATIEPLTIANAAPLAILVAIAVAAQLRPIHVAAKMKFTVEDMATFATVVAYGPAVASLLAAGSKLVLWRAGRGRWWDRAFNASALGIACAVAGITYRGIAVRDDAIISIVALAAAAVAKSAVEYAIIEFAVALQLRRAPFANFLRMHQRELAIQFALYALGALAAFSIRISPVAVVLFVVPMVVLGWALSEKVRLSQRTTTAIFTLADLVDARDPYTRGHSIRVARNAERLARAMHLQPAQVDLIRTAARVHDIGKAATDDHVLLKPGPLDADEQAQMHAHTDHGATLLAALPDFHEGAEIVRAHHERIDGTGYPRGLRGDEIPLEVSIVAIADAYDAMMNDRPYRRAMTWPRARAELLAGRGTQWHDRVVDVFVAMLDAEHAEPVSQPRPVPVVAS